MQELSKERLDALIQCKDVTTADYAQIVDWVKAEPGISQFAPDGICRIDPRNRRMTIYNAARSKRPQDNRSAKPPEPVASSKPCPICEGKTTRPIDVASLGRGFTFINKNLFPCFFNAGEEATRAVTPQNELQMDAGVPVGNHYLQWTSTVHDHDWFNMDVADLTIVLERLGAFETHLLTASKEQMPATSEWYGVANTHGFVLMMKNFGAAVGGSLAHGHQQVTHSNVISKSAYENWLFRKQQGISFSKYMQQVTPESLKLMDLGEAMLAVPYFMRRPMGAMLFVKDDSKTLLSELTDSERVATVTGIRKMVRLYHRLMPALCRDVAYNVLFHTGPGAGIYVEFLPYTQETGGMEQLGLWVCQDTPDGTATVLREYLAAE
ncbi:MAG: hypothetical protein JXR76_14110 [Deltaproteobacteria bacterium]|nr:hypothetical protein [Deltaproteobacteria bacterium]